MHLPNVVATCLRIVFVFVVLAISNGALRAEHVVTADEKHEIGCNKTGAIIEVAVGWTLAEAEKRSPSLARTETPGFDSGLSAYVSKPSLFKYVGAVPFEILCPHMASVMPKDGRVVDVEVGFVAVDPYDFDQAMELMETWRDKFAAMNLDAPSDAMRRNVVSPEEVRSFFHLKSILNLSPIGKSVGSWRSGSEIIGLGIERWNVSPMNLPPKYMYVVGINVSDQSLLK